MSIILRKYIKFDKSTIILQGKIWKGYHLPYNYEFYSHTYNKSLHLSLINVLVHITKKFIFLIYFEAKSNLKKLRARMVAIILII